MTDAQQLENALLNLALNARDAMPDGGQLTDRCDSCVQLGQAQVADFDVAPGCYVALSVSDTGTGMDAATQARASEPFFTTKRFGSGSGLGLSMVYGFAKQSGGGIRIQSALGEGCVVTLVLPCQDDDAVRPIPRPACSTWQTGTARSAPGAAGGRRPRRAPGDPAAARRPGLSGDRSGSCGRRPAAAGQRAHRGHPGV